MNPDAPSAAAPMRLIRLRRPPLLRRTDEPFVPRAVALDEIDRRWRELCRRNPAYFDGRLLHVFGVHRNGHGGATIHVAECAYRHHAVTIAGLDTGARPLGVKGLTTARAPDGRTVVLVGRRSASVAAYAGAWEFAPGGAVEPTQTLEGALAQELVEETGIAIGAGDRVVSRAILHDPLVRSWEVLFEVRLARPLPPRDGGEYERLEWQPLDALLRATSIDGFTPAAQAMRRMLGASTDDSTGAAAP